MPRTRPVVHVEVFALQYGHWCEDCLLSTGVRVWLVWSSGGGMELSDGYGCTECGGSAVTGA